MADRAVRAKLKFAEFRRVGIIGDRILLVLRKKWRRQQAGNSNQGQEVHFHTPNLGFCVRSTLTLPTIHTRFRQVSRLMASLPKLLSIGLKVRLDCYCGISQTLYCRRRSQSRGYSVYTSDLLVLAVSLDPRTRSGRVSWLSPRLKRPFYKNHLEFRPIRHHLCPTGSSNSQLNPSAVCIKVTNRSARYLRPHLSGCPAANC